VEAEITHLNVTRIRSAQPADMLALSRVIRRDRGTVHAEAWLFSHAVVEPVLHATATLSAGHP
jgi:acyl-coenzyme A thioesterase PaaI-like protein